jgi:hypothetical protein
VQVALGEGAKGGFAVSIFKRSYGAGCGTQYIRFLTALSFIVLWAMCVDMSLAAERITPADLEYRGAFRLPDNDEWDYSGYAMTFYPGGDPQGPADGYTGSLFILGHDHRQLVSEVTIPEPVISPCKDPQNLNRAQTLQDFRDIRSALFPDLEIPRAGLAYLPPMGGQETGKIHFCWGQHFQDFEPSHGWCELDLSSPRAAGPWKFGGYTNYVSNDYLFEIPAQWADRHAGGKNLASGRFRDGHWSGMGPALFAYAPWKDGNPPAPGSTLRSITPLLLYGVQEDGAAEISCSDDKKMKYFNAADEWSGGSWLTRGERSAVIFIGTKGLGQFWYGFSNGVRWPTDGDESAACPEVPPFPHNDRGWWSQGIQAQMIFYDTDDLASVAQGAMKTWEPQPFSVLKIDDRLFSPGLDLQRGKRHLVGAAAFDRERGILYVIERRADGERSLVHVWKIR